MQDVTPTPAGEPKQENTFRGLFSRMAIGQCVHAALCVAAGWLRLHWLPCCLFMAIGKFVRYWLVAQTALAG